MAEAWRHQARDLRRDDPERWTYRVLGMLFGVAWSTVRRELNPKVKQNEQIHIQAAERARHAKLMAIARES